ncbi:MAG: NAD/NADP octopine/nopaline dehydrogenase family protein, partial [Pararhizobium sp.]
MFNSISIIGAGHCGCAFAVDTLSRGLETLLYAHPEHARNLNDVAQLGYLSSPMKIEGQFKPRLTQSIAEAVKFSKCLVITTPSFGHDTIVNELKSFDLSDHVLIVINANFFSFAYLNELNARLILETNAAPYASRFADGEILILGIKKNLQIAAYPVDISAHDRNSIAAIFSMPLEWQENVLDVGLQSNNGVFHPATTILNTARIELTKGDFYFYKDGISTSVGRIIESVDQERLAIANAFGYRPPTLLDEMISFYGGEFKSFSDFAYHSTVHNRTKNTPSSMTERYITEDVPFIMVPWHDLGR